MASEIGALRQVMYEPSSCWLSTEYSGDRWLTDGLVLLLVSGHEMFADLPDGPCKLTVSNGPQPRSGIPQPNIEAWFTAVARYTWVTAHPTEWSVAEHPGKAMLWATEDAQPCLVGEPTWTAIKRHHPDVSVEYAAEGNLFQFRSPTPFCYAAGIRVPEGEHEAAASLAGLDATRRQLYAA